MVQQASSFSVETDLEEGELEEGEIREIYPSIISGLRGNPKSHETGKASLSFHPESIETRDTSRVKPTKRRRESEEEHLYLSVDSYGMRSKTSRLDSNAVRELGQRMSEAHSHLEKVTIMETQR